MRDLEIRTQLLGDLRRRFTGDLVRQELGLCLGETRVDLAVVNGHLHGYEIKSDRDTLVRLDKQIDLYGRVLDYSTLVAGHRHIDRVGERVPEFWGLTMATFADTKVQLTTLRPARLNRSVDAFSVAQLLWRDEAASILQARGEDVRSRESRWDLWDRLAALPLRTLQPLVRDALKHRDRWPGG